MKLSDGEREGIRISDKQKVNVTKNPVLQAVGKLFFQKTNNSEPVNKSTKQRMVSLSRN